MHGTLPCPSCCIAVFRCLRLRSTHPEAGNRYTRPRRAAPGGKCTIEVILNGSAEIDILGPTGNLRSLTGEPLGWRRFECTAVLPPNPDGFQIHLTSGRGRLELLRHPLLD